MKRYVIIFLCLMYKISYTQNQYTLNIKPTEGKDDAQIINSLDYQKRFQNERERTKELTSLLIRLYDNGYLTASVDSVISGSSGVVKTKEDSFHTTAFLHVGGIYKWASLKPGNIDEEILSKTGYREKLYNNRPLNYRHVSNIHEKILTWCENNGYPFASVSLDSINFGDQSFSASLSLLRGPEVRIDSVITKGDARISAVYINNYLGIIPGKPYNESLLRKASVRLKELQVVKQTKPHEVVFTDKATKLYLFLDHRRASHFSGVLGVMPNSETTGGLLLTGDAELFLKNSFGRAEIVGITWRSLQPRTQDLKLNFSYPYLFQTPFGIDLQFNLYKRDTQYVNLDARAGIQYQLSAYDYLHAHVIHKSTTLISTAGLEKAVALPPNTDVRTTLYGLGYRIERFDYRLNPSKGFSLYLHGNAGNKTIIRRQGINPLLYDSLKLSQAEYNIGLETDLFIPVFRRTTLLFSTKSKKIISESIFQNELFRFGGLKTLRGFDEESFYASLYTIVTLEWRYLLEENSNLHLFFNWAYYENDFLRSRLSRDDGWTDTPLGLGFGLNFETRAGIFSFAYALGKQFDNPFFLKSGKIHFGIVSRF